MGDAQKHSGKISKWAKKGKTFNDLRWGIDAKFRKRPTKLGFTGMGKIGK
jgi:hypothetical protein